MKTQARHLLLIAALLLVSRNVHADHGTEAAGLGIALIIGFVLFQILPFLGIIVFAILRFSLKKSALSIGTYICFLPFIAFRLYLFMDASEQHDQTLKFYKNMKQVVPHDEHYASSLKWFIISILVFLGYLIFDIYLLRKANRDNY